MSHIRPFKGLRPAKDLAAKISSLPYDVLDTEEARQVIAAEPLSFLTVTKPEATLSEGTDAYSVEVYQQGKFNLLKYIEQKQMVQDAVPCYYIYRQQMGSHIQIGLVAACSVEEYRNNLIKKHELTRVDKETDRVKHIEATQAQTGPVFLTYKSKGQIAALILQIMGDKQPVYDFKATDGIQHTIYVVSELPLVAQITKLFEQVQALYIADGHHRCAAAERVSAAAAQSGKAAGEQDYFLAVIFPDNMMKVMDYNRVVKDLNGLSFEDFFSRLEQVFAINELSGLPQLKGKHQFAMYIDESWYELKLLNAVQESNPVASLDVSILQEQVLQPILGIGDPRTDERIAFVGGIRGLKELENKVNCGEYTVAFALYPTTVEQLMQVADQGLVMPPKSTWFEPKLRDGLVVHLIGDEQ